MSNFVEVKCAVQKRFEQTDFHCPMCGQKQVWRHELEGNTYACVKCKEDFFLNTWVDPIEVGAIELASTLGL